MTTASSFALTGFIAWTLLLLVVSRIFQSLVHLASLSPTAVTIRFTAFAVQMEFAIRRGKPARELLPAGESLTFEF